MYELELEFLEGLGSEGLKIIIFYGVEGKDIVWLNIF